MALLWFLLLLLLVCVYVPFMQAVRNTYMLQLFSSCKCCVSFLQEILPPSRVECLDELELLKQVFPFCTLGTWHLSAHIRSAAPLTINFTSSVLRSRMPVLLHQVSLALPGTAVNSHDSAEDFFFTALDKADSSMPVCSCVLY